MTRIHDKRLNPQYFRPLDIPPTNHNSNMTQTGLSAQFHSHTSSTRNDILSELVRELGETIPSLPSHSRDTSDFPIHHNLQVSVFHASQGIDVEWNCGNGQRWVLVLRFCGGICRRSFPTALSCAVRHEPYSKYFSRGYPVKDMTKDNLDNGRELLIVVMPM